MEYTPVYYKTIQAIGKTSRLVSSCGGTRSGKTFANLQCIYQLALLDKRPTITSVVSETFPHLKRGAMRDFQDALGDLWDESAWSKSESIYHLQNGSIIEFFSADTPSKVHGPARDRLFLNEIQNIPYEIARQLFVRTRGLVLMDYNPTASFWGNEIMEARPDCQTIHSTYKDNSHLTPEQVREIESNRGDANWWKVYGLGEFGSLEGLIYKFELIDQMPEPAGLREVWGMDFGFTHDPTAIVRVLADTRNKILYMDERCYKAGMLNRDISSLLQAEGIKRGTHIWADAAEPKSIAEIAADTGLQVRACNKSAPTTKNRLTFQIQWMQGWRIFITKSSVNLIKEGRNYTWAKDRDGNLLNEPIDIWNHCFPAGTMILTPEGQRPIETIREGDSVMTSAGIRKVEKFFDNGFHSLLDLSLIFSEFAIRLRGTPNHKVKTQNGWKRLDKLMPGDVLYLPRNLMGISITSTRERNIFPVAGNGFTGLYGSSIMAPSRKGTRCITRTAIPGTMIYPTLNVSRGQSIRKNIMMSKCAGVNHQRPSQISTEPENLRRNGTPRKKATTGIVSTPANNLRPWKYGKQPANAAVQYSNINPSRYPVSARINAKQNGGEMRGWIMRKGSVFIAEKNSSQIITPTPSLVQGVVLQNIVGRPGGIERVFDLCVEGEHEYFANGVLVHNCMDAARYAAFSELAGTAGNYNISFNR